MVQRGLVDVEQAIFDHPASSYLGSQTTEFQLVKALLELGADPKVKGKEDPYTARAIANHLGHTDIRDLLLSADKLKKEGPRSGKKKNEKRKREKRETRGGTRKETRGGRGEDKREKETENNPTNKEGQRSKVGGAEDGGGHS